MPSWNVLLTRDEAIFVLAALDSAKAVLAGTEHLSVLLDVQTALDILSDRTFDLPEGTE